MTVPVRIECPWPPQAVRLNARSHRAVKANAAAKYRHDCRLAAIADGAATRCYEDKLDVTITFHPPDKRRRDMDNLIGAFKAGQDGISDCIKVDDYWFTPTYRRGEPVAGGKVVFETTAIA